MSDFWVNCPFKTFNTDFKGTEFSPEAMTEGCTRTETLQRSKGHLSAKCVLTRILAKSPCTHIINQQEENNTTFCMFLMTIFQFLREKTQLASFKHVIMLISCFSSCFIFITISSPQWWGVVNHNNVLAKHNGKSVVLIIRGEHREQSRLCLCRLFEGEREKRKHKISLWIIEALWVSV